jgi:hypothetical protein
MIENKTIDLGETGILITDMDDVLVNFSPVWYLKIRINWEFFKPYFKDFGNDITPLDVLNRKHYNLLTWLKRDDVEKIPDEILKGYYSLYTDCDFYADCVPTPFCRVMQGLAQQKVCNKIYIISHALEGTHESKINFYNRYLRNEKTDLILAPSNIKKSTIINENIGDFDLFVDDSSAIMTDVISNTDGYFKKFLYPILGHNDPERNPTLKKAAEEKKAFLYGYEEII